MSKKSPSPKAAVAKTIQPKAVVAKKSGPASAPEKLVVEETSKKEEHVYEVVTPRDFLRPDSWSDQSGVPVGRRWWRQKAKKKQALVLSELTGCFCVILIIIIVLIGIGAYYIIKKHREAGSRLDPRLTSKTALCRQQYPDVDPECIMEDPQSHQNCSRGATLCRLVRWRFWHNNSRNHLEPESTSYRINVTEHADCGHDPHHPEWCIDGKCQPADVHPDRWFRSVPFPNPKGRYISRNIDELPCLEVQNGSESAFNNLVSWYVGDCGHSSCENHCNRSVCNANSMVKHGFRVRLLHCDLTMDPTTGSRAYPCDGMVPPLEMVICSECENYDKTIENSTTRSNKTKELAKVKCGNQTEAGRVNQCWFMCRYKGSVKMKPFRPVPDGMLCVMAGEKTSFGQCLQGQCVALHHPGKED